MVTSRPDVLIPASLACLRRQPKEGPRGRVALKRVCVVLNSPVLFSWRELPQENIIRSLTLLTFPGLRCKPCLGSAISWRARGIGLACGWGRRRGLLTREACPAKSFVSVLCFSVDTLREVLVIRFV